MSSFTTPLRFEDIDGDNFCILENFQYDVGEEGSGETVKVPEGFITDLASVPRGLWNLFPKSGKYNKAAVVHDFLYRMRGRNPLFKAPTNIWQYRIYRKGDVDGIFREAMGVLGVNMVTRGVMWSMVRAFGRFPDMPRISMLGPKEVFVFGSNLAGRHGAGAALQARYDFGAVYGVGEGLTGQCYAFPTLDAKFQRRTDEELQRARDQFYGVARALPEWRFLMTPVGTGLAGYPEEKMIRLFLNPPSNVVLPPEWVVSPMSSKPNCPYCGNPMDERYHNPITGNCTDH